MDFTECRTGSPGDQSARSTGCEDLADGGYHWVYLDTLMRPPIMGEDGESRGEFVQEYGRTLGKVTLALEHCAAMSGEVGAPGCAECPVADMVADRYMLGHRAIVDSGMSYEVFSALAEDARRAVATDELKSDIEQSSTLD